MKILASDYDGTLHFEDGYHKEDIEAIRRFQEAGHLFGLCSGRALGNLSQLEKEDGLHFDFLIGASGAALSADGKIIYEKTIPYEVFEELYERMDGHHLFVETKKDTYAVKEDLGFFPWIVSILDLTDPEVLKNEDIVHASIEFKTEAELYAVLLKIEDLRDQIEFYQNGPSLDFVPKGYSKKTGVEQMAKHFNVEEADTACIGDNYNDLPMITGIHNSYTFHHAPRRVQESALHVVGSIAECIDDLLKK